MLMFNDRLVVDPLEKNRNDANENVGIIKINCEQNMYRLNMYVYPFAEVQQ